MELCNVTKFEYNRILQCIKLKMCIFYKNRIYSIAILPIVKKDFRMYCLYKERSMKKIVIKCFSTPHYNYVYDRHSNSVVS